MEPEWKAITIVRKGRERREKGGRREGGRRKEEKKINWGNGIWKLPLRKEWYRWKVERMAE